VTRCRWVDSRRAEGFPVTLACAVAAVSTSVFFLWSASLRQPASGPDLDEPACHVPFTVARLATAARAEVPLGAP
jgi:hypothetical protein